MMRNGILGAFNNTPRINPWVPVSRSERRIDRLQRVVRFLSTQVFDGMSWGWECSVYSPDPKSARGTSFYAIHPSYYSKLDGNIYMDTRQLDISDGELIAILLHEFRHLCSAQKGMTRHEKEYDADFFSRRLGFGAELVRFLGRYSSAVESKSHPAVKDRINVLLDIYD